MENVTSHDIIPLFFDIYTNSSKKYHVLFIFIQIWLWKMVICFTLWGAKKKISYWRGERNFFLSPQWFQFQTTFPSLRSGPV